MVRPGFTDSHCHLLPGVDDGPGTVDEAIAMAAALADAGFSRVWCTPHRITGLYETDPGAIRSRVVLLQDHISRAGIGLTVHPGSEYCLDEFLLARLSVPLPLDEGRVLVEVPPGAQPAVIPDIFFRMIQSGHLPLIAHPERSPILASWRGRQEGNGTSPLATIKALFSRGRGRRRSRNSTTLPPLLTLLKEMGCRFQGNIGSFAGLYGEKVRKTACRYLDAGLYDRLGSDAHDAEGIEDWLPEGLAVVKEIVGPTRMHQTLRGPTA